MSFRAHSEAGAAAPLIRILDADSTTLGLLKEWLISAGFAVASAHEPGAAVLMIVDIPFTRHGGRDVVERASARYPDTPILALSPTFFSNVECGGHHHGAVSPEAKYAGFCARYAVACFVTRGE